MRLTLELDRGFAFQFGTNLHFERVQEEGIRLLNIRDSTQAYERWLAGQTRIIARDLDKKHREMSKAGFPFMRATFYRWAQIWPEVSPESAASPTVLAVGDLHVENFGTWRDGEARLVWGVSDFDEACPMPYTIDLVRLAASALLAIREDHLNEAADAMALPLRTAERLWTFARAWLKREIRSGTLGNV